MKRDGKTELMNTLTEKKPESSIDATEPISLAESKRLIELEKIIKAGCQTFVEVGTALAEIRDARLYKSDFATFEDYCIGKWGWSKQHCYRLIECAPIAKSNPQVTRINQARELAKVPKEKRESVIKTAVTKAKAAGRPITAKDIQVAASRTPESEPNFKRSFPAAKRSLKEAESWWLFNATPERRGWFFEFLLSHSAKRVEVADKKAFTEQVMRWLAENVSESGGGHTRR
jgi:hypothetical protein